MVAVCAISLRLSRGASAGLLASGSYSASMETAVRSTSMGGLSAHLQERLDFRGNRPVRDQRRFELFQLRLLRQPTVPQQVDDFLKRGVLGQRVDAETLVAQEPARRR